MIKLQFPDYTNKKGKPQNACIKKGTYFFAECVKGLHLMAIAMRFSHVFLLMSKGALWRIPSSKKKRRARGRIHKLNVYFFPFFILKL